MRGKLVAGVAAAGLLGSGLVFVSPASAQDNGDGRIGCNVSEICFARDEVGDRYRKQFWWSSSHTNLYWADLHGGTGGDLPMRDSADWIANRDTVCDVTVVDDRGTAPDDTHTVENQPASKTWINIKDSVDDENDRHERC